MDQIVISGTWNYKVPRNNIQISKQEEKNHNKMEYGMPV